MVDGAENDGRTFTQHVYVAIHRPMGPDAGTATGERCDIRISDRIDAQRAIGTEYTIVAKTTPGDRRRGVALDVTRQRHRFADVGRLVLRFVDQQWTV